MLNTSPFKLTNITCTNCGLKNINVQFDQMYFEPAGNAYGVINTILEGHPEYNDIIEVIKINFPAEGTDISVEFDCPNRVKMPEQFCPCGNTGKGKSE
jgi:hypothetical protein